MTDLPTQIRAACARVAARAEHVSIVADAIDSYATALPLSEPAPTGHAAPDTAAFWLTLDAINFGSGWFPTLRKRPDCSGYTTVATGLRERFDRRGPWTPDELQAIGAAELARALGQDPGHELMALFAASLRDLGANVAVHGSFEAVVRAAQSSAVTLATTLSRWPCFEDVSTYDGEPVPFYKRAQIAAADLARAGTYTPRDLGRLTMFADNLVPHVLRLDGILRFERGLTSRIERGELIVHGSAEEVEIRACALHAVELIVAARPGTTAAAVDEFLWNRGREPRYKASPRHRSRCTAY